MSFGAALVYKLSSAYKWLYSSICFIFCIELAGLIIRINHKTNIWLYNFGFIFFYLFYLIFYYKNAKKDYNKLIVLFVVYLILWGVSLYITGINIFFKIPSIFLSCSLVFLYCLLLFNETINFRGKLWFSPLFILCVGIIINHGCLVPYYAFIDLLGRAFPKKSLNLIFAMHGFFDDFLYLSILVSLYLNYRQSIKHRLMN